MDFMELRSEVVGLIKEFQDTVTDWAVWLSACQGSPWTIENLRYHTFS